MVELMAKMLSNSITQSCLIAYFHLVILAWLRLHAPEWDCSQQTIALTFKVDD